MPKDAAAADADTDATVTEAGSDQGTLADGGDAGDKAVAPTWPDDWRQQLAGDDEKALNKLKRLQSPADVWKSYRALESRAGEMKAPLPENPTDEQVAEYRKANGIPETPDGYLENLPGGIVVGEDDKPILSAFAEKMHAKHVPPAVVSEAVAWYYAEQEERMAALAESDKAFRARAEDDLRAEWGSEYRANINTFRSFLDTAPEGLKDQILGGRLANGSAIGDSPEFLKWVVSLAHEVNPVSTVVPGSGGNAADSIEDELARIDEVRRTNRAKYNKDEKMQARERQLLDARAKMNSRAA